MILKKANLASAFWVSQYKAECPDSNIVFLENTLIGGQAGHSS